MKVKHPLYVLFFGSFLVFSSCYFFQETYKNVTIKLCPPNMLGCAQRAVLEDKEVLIDPVTEEAKDEYEQLVNETRERGLLQTPPITIHGRVVAEFEVIKIRKIKGEH